MRIRAVDGGPRRWTTALAGHDEPPDWLVLGPALPDETIEAAVDDAKHRCPGIRWALLGNTADDARCLRWLRRGCDAYLSAAADPGWVAGALLAAACGLTVVDQRFNPDAAADGRPVSPLTRREREVLGLLRTGSSNREIGARLHLASSTVEFHVRNVLAKLGVKNRTAATARAAALGL
ncbi:LuxR C-terminal-related transcriptional regulator [Streptomyces sp. NPDC008001]|uniref:helix-turn-helix transcriptional regulator n=1 Tax=Streptomyces sp. NPDC008001 TaxID=3364804 RepID=UPI0036E86F00